MHNYWTWFEVDVASGFNAHIHYLADTLAADSCLFVQYLSRAVEIPIHKRCFKTKATVISPLIRTSDVGRNELEEIRDRLDSDGFTLGFRRSPKKKFLNQVTAPIPIDDPLYPLNIRSILETIAAVIGEEMPNRVVIGYHKNTFDEILPGDVHHASKAATLAYNLGKKIGSHLRK